MAVNVQIRANGRAQLRVTHKLLPRPFFFTFDTEPEARGYGDQLQALLDRGVVPAELLAPEAKAQGENPTLVEMISRYCKGFPVTASDSELLTTITSEVLGVRWSHLNYRWVDDYVAGLKRPPLNRAPGTIRKRVGVLARVVDYYLRTSGMTAAANPFKLLPRGYSSYGPQDAEQGSKVRHDVHRDRRMAPEEAARVDDALAGVKRPDRERPWGPDAQFEMLYRLLVNQGLRLREAVVAQVADIDHAAGIINIRGSKGARGRVKMRVMPIHPDLRGPLRAWCAGRVGRLFDYWDGDPDRLRRVGGNLSARFRTLFDYVDAPDFKEHDLRHEACCRWMVLRDARRGWAFSELEICRMFGWSDPKIMMRYASLRGSDLAARLA